MRTEQSVLTGDVDGVLVRQLREVDPQLTFVFGPERQADQALHARQARRCPLPLVGITRIWLPRRGTCRNRVLARRRNDPGQLATTALSCADGPPEEDPAMAGALRFENATATTSTTSDTPAMT